MDRVKRNAEIVALVKARKMPMRKIAARYGLSTQSISRIAIRQGVHAKALDPNKVLAASKLIARRMPLTHVAETVGIEYKRLRHLLEKQGVYKVPLPPADSLIWGSRKKKLRFNQDCCRSASTQGFASRMHTCTLLYACSIVGELGRPNVADLD